MNKTIITFAFLVILSACKEAPKDSSSIDTAAIETDASNVKEPKLDFGNDMSHDFGTIIEGEKVEHTFKFTNTGDADLVISSATASCGCTIPSPPKEPIAPGEEGEIKVEFNSAGKSAMQTKDITILANTNPVKTILQIKVFVEKKDN
jgi:uncharacterized cupredoxin-like copper-binding protein